MKTSSAEIVDEIGQLGRSPTFFPSGWEDMAGSRGALKRSRGFPDAEALFASLLIHSRMVVHWRRLPFGPDEMG